MTAGRKSDVAVKFFYVYDGMVLMKSSSTYEINCKFQRKLNACKIGEFNSISSKMLNTNENNTESGGGLSAGGAAVTGQTATMLKECAYCGKLITERFLLKALDSFWHEDCLKCGCCDCRLGEVGSTLYTKADLILCRRDYLRLFGSTGLCAACTKVIPAFEMVMRAKNNVYHLECFACQQCNHRFCVGDRFYLCDNKILCEYDYEERLVFANMAYNPSSLAHIRRQVSQLQPARGNVGRIMEGHRQVCNVAHFPPTTLPTPTQITQQQNQQQQPQRDDGSSGYGSPDSETLESVIQ